MTSGRLGCAAAIGAALALPVGIFIGSQWPQSPEEQAKVVSSSGGQFRNVYSPEVLSDPYVRDQHRRIVEDLELSCREQKLYCREAAQARLAIEQQDER